MPRPRKDTTPRNIAPYARRVKELREDHDMTQQEVADVLNLGQRTYADYELGNIRIPIEMLVSLARYYNVDMNYICGLTTIRRSFPSQSSIRSITPPGIRKAVAITGFQASEIHAASAGQHH